MNNTKIIRTMIFVLISAATITSTTQAAQHKPISLHRDNPHYFQWRNKPTILITSGEHYGAVLNSDFDYRKYFDTLQKYGFNLTRTFTGAYCEPVGAFKIKDNTLAPLKNKLICPWSRSAKPGYPNGGNKFDLTKFDNAYFARLKDFLTQAGKRGIVVELVLFCPFYKDDMWKLSPMNAANNINGIGTMPRTDVYTLKHPELLKVQDAMVAKIVTELKDFDNLYYEICNEPYFGGVTLPWQAHIADTIISTEKQLGTKHLIAQNIANKTQKIQNPDPDVSIFNFHYAKPPTAVYDNYHLDKPIGDDETGFAGTQPKPYRLEGWDFIIAGGAVYNNLDYSFNVTHEDGSAIIDAPGSGGPILHRQLQILSDFINSFDFTKMKPDNSVIKGSVGEKTTARALVENGNQYAIYINGPNAKSINLNLPKGTYRAEWVNTKTGQTNKQTIQNKTGRINLPTPKYKEDIALKIVHAKRAALN